jgi:predicted DCC family thiol-disulfide oxidoreductase YuxK
MKSNARMHNDKAHILLFDGVCNLCNGIVQFIIKRDTKGKFKFAYLQSERGQLLLKKIGLPTNDLNSLVYINGEKYLLKSTAALHILKELGGVWKIAYVLIIIPRPLRDLAYDIIAKTRSKLFGRRDSCMVPAPDLRSRFLE